MSRRTANVIGAAVLGAAMLFGVAALQAQQAQQAPQTQQQPSQGSPLVVAGTSVVVRSSTSGWVHIDARRGSNRVGGWYAPSAIEAWAADAERILSGEGLDTTSAARRTVSVSSGERVEFKTRLLMSADTGAMVLDRVEQDAGLTHALFLSDKGSMHRMYLPMNAAEARTFVETLRGAALSSRQLAEAAAKAATPVVAEKTRSGGM